MARRAALCSLLLAVGVAAAPPTAMRGRTRDINTHSTLEQHAQDLQEAQHEVTQSQNQKPLPRKTSAEDMRSDSVMHLAESAKAAKAAQREAEGGEAQGSDEEEGEGRSASGIPGLGQMVQADDPNLAHVDVTQVNHLPPQKVLGLKKAVGKMQDAVVGGRDARAAAEAPRQAAAVPEKPSIPLAAEESAPQNQDISQMGPAARAVAAKHAVIAASSQTAQQAARLHEEFKTKMESHTTNMHQSSVDHAREIEEQRLAEEAAHARQRAEEEARRLQVAKERADAERRKAEDAALRLRAAEVNARMNKEQEEARKVQEKTQVEAAAKAVAERAAKAEATEEQRAQKEREDAERDEAHKKLVEYRTQQKAMREQKNSKEDAVDMQRRQAIRERVEADRVEREVAEERGSGGPVPLDEVSSPTHKSWAAPAGHLQAFVVAAAASALCGV